MIDFARFEYRHDLHARRPRRSPSIATFLSFLWPGLGQWYEGRTRTAILFGVPPCSVVALLLLIAAFGGVEPAGRAAADARRRRITIVILIGLLAVWRLLVDGRRAQGRAGHDAAGPNCARDVRRAGRRTLLIHGCARLHGLRLLRRELRRSSSATPRPTAPRRRRRVARANPSRPDDEYNVVPVATPETPSRASTSC